jgi:hypothetical protein
MKSLRSVTSWIRLWSKKCQSDIKTRMNFANSEG